MQTFGITEKWSVSIAGIQILISLLPFEPGLVNKHLRAVTDNICEATGCFPGAQHPEITGYSSFLLSTGQRFHFLLDCTTLLLMPLSICKFPLLNSLCGQHPMALLWEQTVFVVWHAFEAEEFTGTALWKRWLGSKCLLILRTQSEWRAH